MLSLALLGPFQARFADEPVARLKSSKAQALLILFAVEADRVYRRESLMAMLWPDLPLKSAQQSLRQAIYMLRKQVEEVETAEPLLLADRHRIQLNSAFPLQLDITRFKTLARQQEPGSWQQAADLYRGDFVADFFLPDSEPFEEWTAAKRAELRETALETLHRLASYYLQEGDFAGAEKVARQQLEIDNLREGAHRQLMEALARDGRRQLSIAHFDSLRSLLSEELAIEPAPQTLALYQAIRTGELVEADAGERGQEIGPPVSAESTLPTRVLRIKLPAQSTPLIGREEELAEIDDLFSDQERRLVTILGPGGMGKTHLAVAWAARQMDNGEAASLFNSAFFVDLAPLSRAAQIINAIADTLDFQFQAGGEETRSPEEQLLDYLRQKDLLLILDNFEHLLDGAALVDEMLNAAPGLKILATSREPLKVRWEQRYPIEGLHFPATAGEESLETYPAVQLFLNHARRMQPHFALHQGEQEHLVAICRQLDGVPLAIELAASWVDLLPVAELKAEIDRSLDLLQTTSPGLPPRHRSIRATFESSWKLLDQAQRDVFAQLSVFRGGFFREAGQAVAGTAADPTLFLRHLSALNSKSFLRYGEKNRRYQIHELMRQYGMEKLGSESGGGARERQAVYFARLLQEAEVELKGANHGHALQRIDADRENIQVAWSWLVENGAIADLYLALDSMGIYAEDSGRYPRGYRNFAMVTDTIDVDRANDGEGEIRRLLARAMIWQALFDPDPLSAARLAERSQDLLNSLPPKNRDADRDRAFTIYRRANLLEGKRAEESIRTYETALSLYRDLGDHWGIGLCLEGLGRVDFWLEQRSRARERFIEALSVYRDASYERGQPRVYLWLTFVATQEADLSTVTWATKEGLALLETMDQPILAPIRMNMQSQLAYVFGRFDEAARMWEQTIQTQEQQGRSRAAAESDSFYALDLLHLGQVQAAQASIRRALAYFTETDKSGWIAWCRLVESIVALVGGNFAGAEQSINEAIDTFRAQNQRADLAGARAYLALAHLGQGDDALARELLVESLREAAVLPAYLPNAEAMLFIALILAQEGELDRARALYEFNIRNPFVRHSKLYEALAGGEIRALCGIPPLDQLEPGERIEGIAAYHRQAKQLINDLPQLGWPSPG